MLDMQIDTGDILGSLQAVMDRKGVQKFFGQAMSDELKKQLSPVREATPIGRPRTAHGTAKYGPRGMLRSRQNVYSPKKNRSGWRERTTSMGEAEVLATRVIGYQDLKGTPKRWKRFAAAYRLHGAGSGPYRRTPYLRRVDEARALEDVGKALLRRIEIAFQKGTAQRHLI